MTVSRAELLKMVRSKQLIRHHFISSAVFHPPFIWKSITIAFNISKIKIGNLSFSKILIMFIHIYIYIFIYIYMYIYI